MKKRKFQRKISLNKETIAKLNQGEMNDAQGGRDTVLCGPVPIETRLINCIETLIAPCFETFKISVCIQFSCHACSK